MEKDNKILFLKINRMVKAVGKGKSLQCRRVLTLSVIFCCAFLISSCGLSGEETSPPTEIPPTDEPSPVPVSTSTSVVLPSPTPQPATPTAPDPLFPLNNPIITAGNVWKLKLVAEIPDSGAVYYALSPDNRFIGYRQQGIPGYKILDILTSRTIIIDPALEGYEGKTSSIDFLDESGIVNISGESEDLLWDAETGANLGESDPERCYVYSNDRSLRAYNRSDGGRRIIVENSLTGEQVQVFRTSAVAGLDFSADNKFLVSMEFDVFQRDTYFWDIERGIKYSTLYAVECVNFAEGDYFAAVLQNDPGEWVGELALISQDDFSQKKILTTQSVSLLEFGCPQFGYRSELVVAQWGDQIRFWDTESGSELKTIPASGTLKYGFSQDSTLFYTYAHNQNIKIYAVQD